MSPRHTAPPVDGATRDHPTLRRTALARGAGRHVLIAAGEPDLAELLSTTLDLAGYRISLSGTGTEALARVAEQHFDLVVLDTALPDMADFGGERRPTLPRRPPVLLLTEYDSLHRLVPEVGLGERDYVTKPVRVAEVLARIQVLLRGTRPRPPSGTPLRTATSRWTTPCAGRRAGRGRWTSRPPSTG